MKGIRIYLILAVAAMSTALMRAQEADVKAGVDTVSVSASDFRLEEVSVSARRASTVRNRTSAFDTQKMNSSELCKAACCNLSESFETNASVDVAYSDAVTGAKQIRLLGLSGTYVQLLTENTPGIRGLAQQFGMEYIPGPWMESIQISKGTASVLNGYESTTGQINIEYLKPKVQDPIAVNLMLNTELNSEVNVTGGWQVTHPEEADKADVSTGVLAHAQLMPMSMDQNKDGFLDMPMGGNVNLLNRWDIFKGNYTGRILVRGIYDDRQSGQGMGNLFKREADETLYNISLSTKRVEGFMKNGYVIDADREMSIGIITALSYHNQQNRYGKRTWNAAQTNAYLNAMFQIEPAEGHKITTGLSANFDKYTEMLDTDSKTTDLGCWELTPGVFAEYNYHALEQLSLVAGVRADYSTQYGVFFTPRVNVRYSPFEWWTLRASAGMGYRSPCIVADNTAVLASSRRLELPEEGIEQEKAVNTGIVTTFRIPIDGRELQITGEYYYTHFINCVFLDLDTDAHSVYVRNSKGTRNFSHTWQIEASMEILRGWTMTAAFRETDVMQTIGGNLRQKPLTPRFKGLITTSYITPLRRWQFDATVQFNGGGRLPDPDQLNPLWQERFSWYPQLMAQITKYWRTCSLYVGADNMTNYRQKEPVIGAAEPFGADFDASMVYAPISGWKIYLGFRWALAKKED